MVKSPFAGNFPLYLFICFRVVKVVVAANERASLRTACLFTLGPGVVVVGETTGASAVVAPYCGPPGGAKHHISGGR
ncbi:uncharacterized protein CANTADRAFT_141287 [Suhomyces tanzawaensis NRRL Y-17324]|uniref:Secreted protein n=1 Tax=Suhomyces tanzawaensis NRRL Y-17324 TaxID=984487 RepID=A0A1E4SS70_9ASCO|nr:uncharacterized protein CANTADRAFT_141287 [Suhomyces tanzawaensis NRRL Y-17324]ODV82354.1 hypothetical protein CANTADRAFT_141287 [Suhomyces tanzawaensis NRRL Y-17324]